MPQAIDIKITLDEGACVPKYESVGASGMDVCAYTSCEIAPQSCRVVPTGVYMEIPQGYEVQVRSRSGLSAKKQLVVLNSPGTIDSDYRGEIKVILFNHSQEIFTVTKGMRIA